MKNREWYVVNTYSGHEHSVKSRLDMQIESLGLKDKIFNVVVPEQTIIDRKAEEDEKIVETVKQKKLFPGYILVEMIMDDDLWYIIRNTPGVTGFIGSSGKGAKPIPLKKEEINKILKKIDSKIYTGERKMQPGDKVKVIGGPFAGSDTVAIIKSIIPDNEKDKDSPKDFIITISLFGQMTEVEEEKKNLDFL